VESNTNGGGVLIPSTSPFQTSIAKPTIMGNIPITTLANRQRVRLVAFARLGFGKDHQKWCGSCAVSVKQYNDEEDIDSASDFIVHVETTGAMTIKNLVECAASILAREFPTLGDNFSAV
jgi:DNA-directed RNA polymerase subunit D